MGAYFDARFFNRSMRKVSSHMGSRVQLSFGIALSVAVSAASIHSLLQRAPEHEGRGLGEWLDDFDKGASASYERATAAVDRMGTNTLPRLLSLLGSRDSAFDRAMNDMAESQSVMDMNWEMAFDRHWKALRGFQALGNDASPAIPELAARLERAENPEFISFALAGIGIEALPSLQKCATNANAIVRKSSTAALGLLGITAEEAIPALIQRLQDVNAAVRQAAADSLGRIGKQAAKALPALNAATMDNDSGVSQAARAALTAITGG